MANAGLKVPGVETVCLVACTSRKGLYPAAAEFIYRSPLFVAGRNYAETRCDRWFILSAKHGLLSPKDEIAPYDESLHNMDEVQISRWARSVHKQLTSKVTSKANVVFLAGLAYRSYLEPLLREEGRETAAPMSALGIGSQVAWLQKLAKSRRRVGHIDRFYSLLNRLTAAQESPPQSLSVHTAKSVQPKRGVYFFFEQGERRMTSPFEERVTRIGTHSVSHGSKATLWNRLRTHRGGGNGLGNHRGSIFRLHVGDSIIRRSELQPLFPTWGVGQSASREVRASEEEIELEVSDLIGSMAVLWLEVGDEASADSDRTYLERNLIALLAGSEGPIDLPSASWLGRWSSRDAVCSSGLWNVNHVYEQYDPHVLDVLERYVEIAEGTSMPSGVSLAPKGWRLNPVKSRHNGPQIELI